MACVLRWVGGGWGQGSVRDQVFGAGDLATKSQLRWLIIGRMHTQSRRQYLGHEGWYTMRI